MTDRLTINGTALARDGSALVEAADGIVGDLRDLARTLSGLGAAWGTDEVGAEFGRPYTELVEHLVAAVLTYESQIAGTGVALPTGGAVILDVGRSQAAGFDALRGGL